jgi:hypothetical protein
VAVVRIRRHPLGSIRSLIAACLLSSTLGPGTHAQTSPATQSDGNTIRIGAVGSHHGGLARAWYNGMTFRDGPPAFAGLGCHVLPDEGDRSISDDEKPRLVEYYRTRSLDLVAHSDVAWLTGHGKNDSLRYFAKRLFESRDLKDATCSWLVLSACSLIDAQLQTDSGESADAALEGSAARWLLSSPRLHGILGYNGGAAWFGAGRRENVFVGETFAAELTKGTSVARAWMLANLAAAEKYHRDDHSKQFNALNATAVCWGAFENESARAIDRRPHDSERVDAVFMWLNRRNIGDASAWEILIFRGQLRSSSD